MYGKLKDPLDFINLLEQEIRDEADATCDHYMQAWEKAPAERIRLGSCLKISHIRELPRDRLLVRIESNESRLRETDILRISKGDPVDFEHWDVTLENYTGSELFFHWGEAQLMCWN